jgi:hypothetical protein
VGFLKPDVTNLSVFSKTITCSSAITLIYHWNVKYRVFQLSVVSPTYYVADKGAGRSNYVFFCFKSPYLYRRQARTAQKIKWSATGSMTGPLIPSQTEIFVNISAFWDMTPCKSCRMVQDVGEIFCLPLQSGTVKIWRL